MHRRTLRAAAVALTAGASCLAVVVTTASANKTSKGRADSGTTYASIVRSAGGYQYAAGQSTDKLIGPGAITYKLKLAPTKTVGSYTITASPVVLYTSTGALTGTATATVLIAGATEQISNGKLNLTKGSGSLKGHSFVGTFTGSGNVTTNQFVFNDKGTLR